MTLRVINETNNDLVNLFDKFYDSENFPLILSGDLKKLSIPVKDDIRPYRNFLDEWSTSTQSARICTNSYTMKKYKLYNSSLYEELFSYVQKTKKHHKDKNKTTVPLHKDYYSYKLAHKMLSILKDDYISKAGYKEKNNLKKSNKSTNIYLVAGIRNTTSGAVSDWGGLYANVGMTTKDPKERFKGPDYRKKQLAGELVLLKQWPAGEIKDYQIHPYLKKHPDVVWKASKNTEEFLFKNDLGDGSVAIEIIESILIEHLLDLPKFVIDKISAQEEEIKELNRKSAQQDMPNSFLNGSWINQFISLFWSMILSIRL
jgi:hypothetical protein